MRTKRITLTACLLFLAWIAPAQTNSGVQVQAIDAVSMTVGNINRSVEFYSRVLSFEKVSDVEVAGEAYEHLENVFGLRMRVVRMKLGDESIELIQYLTPMGRPVPADSRSNDRWFQHVAIIVSNMEEAYRRLQQNHVEHVSAEPQRLPDWNKNAAGIQAFYFKDPDEHPLEILQFPADKGAAKWHRDADGRLFLGIDHTAITVSDTERSLKFYRDVLGLRVAGESENYGIEQEHLNNVAGAHLRITSFRGASGMGIELLEYLSPRDGREFPKDERANDVVHRQTEVVVGDAEGAARTLQAKKAAQFVSSGVISDSHRQLGFIKAFLVRDPDGHVLEIEEKR